MMSPRMDDHLQVVSFSRAYTNIYVVATAAVQYNNNHLNGFTRKLDVFLLIRIDWRQTHAQPQY
jgi:hypothetical protein